MSQNLTKAQVDLLTAEFHEADLDKTGYLTTYELKNAILKKGKALSNKVIEAMIQDADKDGDGKVNLEEFLKAVARAVEQEAVASEIVEKEVNTTAKKAGCCCCC